LSETNEYQQAMAAQLRPLFDGIDIVCEWRAMTGQTGVYSPRLDIAIGPFAIGNEIYAGEYDRLTGLASPLLEALYERSLDNFARFDGNNDPVHFGEVVGRNYNARCFLAIEIENKSSRKHLMGGAINAAALGRVGIAIGWNVGMVKAFVKLRAYLMYLSRVGKNTFDPYNLLVLSREQFTDAVAVLHRHREAAARAS